MLGLAPQKAAAAPFTHKLSVSRLYLAAHGHQGRSPFYGHAFEAVIVVVDVLGLDADRAAIVGVEDNEIGIAAEGDGALARKEAEKFCGTGAGEIYETIKIDAFSFPHGVEQIDAILDTGNAVGNVYERFFAEKLLVDVERAVIGANGVNETERERTPESVIIMFGTKRGRHNVLHAFGA